MSNLISPLSIQDESADRQRLVLALHSELIDSLEWAAGTITADDLKTELPPLIKQLCQARAKHLTEEEQSQVVSAVLAESIGLGPLEPLLLDPHISDILVNGSQEVYVEKHGRLVATQIRFANDAHLIRIIQRIAARVGRRIDESSPTVDARLEDGSRVHAVVPPLALRGPTLSIRRFGTRPLAIDDLVGSGSITPEMVQFLSAAIEARVSLLISGGTGAGKTTLLNALSTYIPDDERIVTIEDTAELQLQHPHVVSLETRTANTEGTGTVTMRDLVRTSLRMRPDRILIGEVRGPEAIDMLQALNTGHEGSLSTIHANDVRDALARLEIMVGMTGYEFPIPVLRQYITAGLRLVVQVGRLKGGVRRVMQIAEIVGLEDGDYQLEKIFEFKQSSIDSSGKAVGEFRATGYIPQCLQRLTAAGICLPLEIFSAPPEGNSFSQKNSPLLATKDPVQNRFPLPAVDLLPAASEPKPRKLKFKVAKTVLEPTVLEPTVAELKNGNSPDQAAIQAKPKQLAAHDTSNIFQNFEPIVIGLQNDSASEPQFPGRSADSRRHRVAAVDDIMARFLQENKSWDDFDIFSSLATRAED